LIRDAKITDLPILLDMGERFFNASEFVKVTIYDPISFQSTALQLIDSDILLVGEDDGKVVGMIGALVYPLYFNQSHITGQEMFWWVDEDKRKSKVGRDLLRVLEQRAKDMGANSFAMISLDSMNPKLMDRVYKMKGYFPAEHTYYKRIT